MHTATRSRDSFIALRLLFVICLLSAGIGGIAAAAPSTADPTPPVPQAETPTNTSTNGTGTQPTAPTGSAQEPASNSSGTMGTVTLIIQDGEYIPLPGFADDRFRFKLLVTKLNTTTFVAVHRHGQTTKRWYFPNVSQSHANDLWKTDKRAGWPGRLGKNTDKERLAKQIADTKIYREQIKPFMKSQTHRGKSSQVDQPGVGDDLPSFDPVKNFKKLLNALLGLPGWLVTTANNWIFGVPAPGQPTKPSSWINPAGGIWAGVAAFTKWTTGFATIVLAYSGGMTFLSTDPYARRQAWKRWVIALIMILGTWTLLPLGLHMANEITQILRPETSEIFHSWASISKVGVGAGLLAIFAVAQPAIFGIGLFVLSIERMLVYITVGFWPLAWALRSTRNDFARSLGEMVVFLLGVTIATKLGQALIARLLFSLPWGSLKNSVVMLLVIGAGVAFMLIIFPWKMLEYANDAATISLGMSTATKASGRASERASKRTRASLGSGYESLKDWRSNDGETESSIPEHKFIGSFGRGRDDPDRPDYGDSPSSEENDGRYDANRDSRDTEYIDDLNKGYY